MKTVPCSFQSLFTALLLAGLCVSSTAAPDGKDGKDKDGKNGKQGKVNAGQVPAGEKPAQPRAAADAPGKKAPMQGRANDLVRGTSDTPKPNAKPAEKNAAPKPSGGNELTILREAYATLSLADHDYKGHRKAAMNHIDKAAHMLGADFNGDGRAGEPQALSDAQLRAVQATLQKAHDGLGGRPKLQKQVEAAIHELAIALSIK